MLLEPFRGIRLHRRLIVELDRMAEAMLVLRVRQHIQRLVPIAPATPSRHEARRAVVQELSSRGSGAGETVAADRLDNLVLPTSEVLPCGPELRVGLGLVELAEDFSV